jgi:hypothetical protein
MMLLVRRATGCLEPGWLYFCRYTFEVLKDISGEITGKHASGISTTSQYRCQRFPGELYPQRRSAAYVTQSMLTLDSRDWVTGHRGHPSFRRFTLAFNCCFLRNELRQTNF